MISFDAWIFRKRRRFLTPCGLNKTNLVKSALLSIHASTESEKQQSVSAADRDRTQENNERIFSEQMSRFSALICLSFLPWSILSLKEKSGRIILAELNSSPSHVVNRHTGLEIHRRFNKFGHAGRHSSKGILRIGMSRTPELLNIQNLEE